MPNNATGPLDESCRTAVIEHLSKDITTALDHAMTFRSRMGFTLLVGPFVMLGTLLVAKDGDVSGLKWTEDCMQLAVHAGAAYLGFALWGAIFDTYLNCACTKWRRLIVDVARTGGAAVQDSVFSGPVKIFGWCFVGYAAGFGFLLWAFVAVAMLVGELLTVPPAVGSG